jgi:hypothetical protein
MRNVLSDVSQGREGDAVVILFGGIYELIVIVC